MKAKTLSFAAFAFHAESFTIPLLDPSILPKDKVHSDEKLDFFHVLNPAAISENDSNAIIARISNQNRQDAKKIIEKSSEVLPSWRDGYSCVQRSKILTKWSNLIQQHKQDIATIMTMETGKPLKESIGEINYATSFLDFYAGECLRPSALGGGTIYPSTFVNEDGTSPRGKIMTIQESIGVTAMITPWNFPLAMITRKVGPALAAGCTAIVKPSELTPLSAIVCRVLADQAGVPEGVFEIITADAQNTPEVGKEFCENAIIKKISFTGSTDVGRLLSKQSSDTVKRVGLELGGNAPFIVFEDADIDQAVEAAMASKFRNAGQTCVCADRFLLHKSIEEQFLQKFVDQVKKHIKVGDGMLEDTTMGPLISTKAASNVHSKVMEAFSFGGECLLGGSQMLDLGANFYEPTIIRNVHRESQLWKCETFGPVAAISTFETETEAVETANDTKSGLAAYFCSRNLERVFRVSRRLENGIVGINDGIISTASAPFGGVKESGLGREGSTAGLEEFLETKYIFLNVNEV